MDAVVTTQSGKVRGRVVDGARAFKGVPFAAPPFGANRFRAPQPVEPWSGVRDALAYGAKPPQLPYPRHGTYLSQSVVPTARTA
jgi:para-nitrobenzyl esterase